MIQIEGKWIQAIQRVIQPRVAQVIRAAQVALMHRVQVSPCPAHSQALTGQFKW